MSELPIRYPSGNVKAVGYSNQVLGKSQGWR